MTMTTGSAAVQFGDRTLDLNGGDGHWDRCRLYYMHNFIKF